MASKKDKVTELENEVNTDVQFKSYRNDGKGFDDLSEGQEIVGIFVGVKDQEIKDTRTKQRKMVRVYSIRDDEGTVHKIGSRALLDGIFDDIMDEHGGYVVENKRYGGPGMDFLRNKIVKFVRGSNRKTSGGDPMGTYEILVETDD